MSSTDNDTFQLLLEEIKKMNQNLETVSSAVNKLTMQINSVPKDTKAIPPSTGINSNDFSNGFQSVTIDDITDSQQTQTLGYVNWNASHDILIKQKFAKMMKLRDLLDKMKTTLSAPQPIQAQKYDGYGRAITTGQESNTAINHFASLYKDGCYNVVNEELRFPLDAVYLNVESAIVKKEIDFMNKLNVQPTEGVIERFLTICESEMHTCASFEKKYKLKWV